jgi:hypothetical protein
VSTLSTACERSLRVTHVSTQRHNHCREWLLRAAVLLSSQPDADTTVGDDNAANLPPPTHVGSRRHWIPAGWHIAQRGTRGWDAFREKTWQARIRTLTHMRLG